MNIHPSAVPLGEALPWCTEYPSFVVVGDSIGGGDGRCVLSTWAAHVIQSVRRGRVVWIAQGAFTHTAITATLQKLGCNTDSVSHETASAETSSPLRIVELPKLWDVYSSLKQSTTITSSSDDDDGNDNKEKEQFLKNIYHDLKCWLKDSSQGKATCWFILDDISTMATIFGKRLSYVWLSSVRALTIRHSVGLLMRCDQYWHQQPIFHPEPVSWIGSEGYESGAVSNHTSSDGSGRCHTTPHSVEQAFIEVADWVVDVTPLVSGSSRDVHGRLLFSSTQDVLVFNYCLVDNKVLAIRVLN